MSIIQRLQHKSRAQKMLIIWSVTIAAVILLILIWALSYSYRKDVSADTTLWQTMTKGAQDVKNNFHH